MKNYLRVLGLLFFVTSTVAQDLPQAPYLFPDSIEELPSYLKSTYLSRIGEFEASLAIHCKGYEQAPPDSLNLIRLESSKALNAKRVILQTAEKHQVVMFNEAHHSNRQRRFVQELLPDLKALGYTIFCAETFDHRYIDQLNKSGNPEVQSGYYSASPAFGELLRSAHSLGFTFKAYETNSEFNFVSPNTPEPVTPEFKGDSMAFQIAEMNYQMNNRDYYQFAHIEKVLTENPEAKIIIYCGYDHLNESKLFEWETLGSRLKSNLGIDPLTIDLTIFSENCLADNYPLYSIIAQKKYRDPSILVAETGENIEPVNEFKDRDYFVYFPSATMGNGRPDWLFISDYQPVESKDRPSKEHLAFAYYKGEDIKTTVPADIIYYDGKGAPSNFCLRPGTYTIRYLMKNGGESFREIKVQ